MRTEREREKEKREREREGEMPAHSISITTLQVIRGTTPSKLGEQKSRLLKKITDFKEDCESLGELLRTQEAHMISCDSGRLQHSVSPYSQRDELALHTQVIVRCWRYGCLCHVISI